MDINRITVEFKENLENGICNLFRILIESQWNLKTFTCDCMARMVSILIESQWNLKFSAKAIKLLALPILIESQWNLKSAMRMP